MKNFPEETLATHGQRILNWLADCIVINITFFILVTAASFMGTILGYKDAVANYFINLSVWENYLYGILLLLIYYHIMEGATSRSIGKYITKTMVVDEHGVKLSSEKAFIRSLCRLIPFDIFSFLNANARGWHDTVSKTYVVDVQKFQSYQRSTIELDQLGKDKEEL